MNVSYWIVPGLCALSVIGYVLKLRGETKVKEELLKATDPNAPKKYTDKELKEFCREFDQWSDVHVQHSPNDNTAVWTFECTRDNSIYPRGYRVVGVTQWDMLEGLMRYRDQVKENK